MSEALPSRVDAMRLAARGASLDNVTPVAAMTRLGDALADASGTVESQLVFTRDAQGRTVIDGRAHAVLQLVCQRCLQSMPFEVDVAVRVAVVGDDGEAQALAADAEPVIGDSGEVSPLALVEDELILALPLVPLHAADAGCRAPADAPPAAAVRRENPFAVLKRLKTDNDSSGV